MNLSAACTFETLTSPEAFEGLAAEWDVLVRAMPRPSPFLLHTWLVEWWRHFGSGARLAVVIARRDGRLVGGVPLFVRRRGGARVARFLGGHESALADLLLDASEPESTARGLIDQLRGESFDYADLFGVPIASRLAAATSGELSFFERVESPVLVMPDGWDAAYAAKTSSKRRALHLRRLRQLRALGDCEFVVGRTQEELEPLLEEAFRLHALRWRGRPDASTFGTKSGQAFHRAALRRFGDEGVMQIVMLRVAGRSVAFDHTFTLGETLLLHRLGFDPSYSQYSPGLVTTLETLRGASANGVTRVEFLGGGERYKFELADRQEPLYQAIGFVRNPLGALAARQRLELIRLRKALKRNERIQRIYLNGFNALRRSKRRGRG